MDDEELRWARAAYGMFQSPEKRKDLMKAIDKLRKETKVLSGLEQGLELAAEEHNQIILNADKIMDENIVVNDAIKTGFNVGVRLGETAEGRKKAVELTKGKEDLPISQAIAAGVRQAMKDDLANTLKNLSMKKKTHKP